MMTNNILITRPIKDAKKTAKKFKSAGFEPIIASMLKMQILEFDSFDLTQFSIIIFTSLNAIRAFKKSKNFKKTEHLICFAVGNKTAAKAKKAGFKKIINANGDIDKLIEIVKKHGKRGDKIFYPHGRHISKSLIETFKPTGLFVKEMPVYEMKAAKKITPKIIEALQSLEINKLSFYSSRTAQVFCDLTKNQLSKKTREQILVFCLSNNISNIIKNAGFSNIHIAKNATEKALIKLATSLK